jgi:hypothetical protein
MLSEKMLMNAAGIPSKESNQYKKMMRIINKTHDFYSYIKTKIEDYKTKIDKCKNTCLSFICEKERDSEKCEEIKRMSTNAQTEEELELNIKLKKNTPTEFLSKKCVEYAENNVKKNPELNAIVDDCYAIGMKENEITNLIYVWLLETYRKYKEGDNSENLITEYNQIYDLTKTLPILFNNLNINVIFKQFNRIELETSMDNTGIVSVNDINIDTSTNPDLTCKKIDNSDPLTLKCQWKKTGIGGNHRNKRKRYTKRRSNKSKQKKRVSRHRKR